MAETEGRTLVFLSSGGGGNLRFIHQAMASGWLPGWQRIVVLADRECGATAYARQHDLEWTCLDFKCDGQGLVLSALSAYAPNAIITTVHRVLSDAIVSAFDGLLLNLHYSLLPAFGGTIGTAPVQAAIDHGVCLGGATVHQVTRQVDAGQPLVQLAIPFARCERVDAIMDYEFRAGCIALLVALRAMDAGDCLSWQGMPIRIKDRQGLLNPSCALPVDIADEAFWGMLK